MTTEELYKLGEEAYGDERYDDALEYFTQAAPDDVDAAAYVPLCYLNYASQVSLDASHHASDTEYLVRGQQKAVKILDTAIRSALTLFRDYVEYPYVCNIASSVIAQATDLQYALVSTGLTIAYNITNTTTTTEKIIERTTVDGEVVNERVVWEYVVGTETESFVSLASYDMKDYHILGPDEKTKRIKASLETIRQNTVQLAEILECLDHGHDAHMLRATLACAMTESEGGDRSMLLSAEWFISTAKELAKTAITDPEVHESWESLHEDTFNTFRSLSSKYEALMRNYRKRGYKPSLAKFYPAGSNIPAVESSEAYMKKQEMNNAADKHSGVIGDVFEVFLTVFAQVSFMKIFPTILFASIISIFCGGMFHVLSSDAGEFVKIFGIVWFIITMLLTFFRTVSDADEFRTNNTFGIYMGIMLGTGLLFSVNFIFPLIAYIVLNVLAKRYK